MRPVRSPADVVANVARFNRDARHYPDLVRSICVATTYWVHEPASGTFGPSKFVGYAGMTFDTYRRAGEHYRMKQSTGAPFDGGYVKPKIEAVTGEEYRPLPELVGRLVEWGTRLIEADVFGNADRTKWKFIVLDAPDDNATESLQAVAAELDATGYFAPDPTIDQRRRVQQEIVQRQGQPAFRQRLLTAYGGRCAVTGCDATAALEAAHIDPYSGPASQRAPNGLLLRADLHTLFDLDQIGFDPDTLAVALTPALAATAYVELQGVHLRVPTKPADRPDRAALSRRWMRFNAGE